MYLIYEGTDLSQIMLKLPCSVNFEIFVFEFCLKLLIEINNSYFFNNKLMKIKICKNRVTSTIYENELIIKKEANDEKKYYSVSIFL